jgi:hypothetical protein
MSEKGFIAIARGILDHPLVGARKPFSPLEAWQWFLLEAVWKTQRIGFQAGRYVGTLNLERGQLSHSLRFIARRLGWSVKRLRTFLARLEADGMITTQTDTGQTLITICNYNNYQTALPSEETQAHTQTGTQRARNGHKEEEGNKETNNKDIPAAGSSSDSKYAFEAGIIRLTEKDFEQWRAAFSYLDLAAELTSMRSWAEDLGKSRWFSAIPNALAKRNREAKVAFERSKSEASFKWNGHEGVI